MHQLVSRRPRLGTVVVAGGLALGLSLLGAGSAVAAPSTTSVTLTATPTVEVGKPIDVSVGLKGAVDVYSYAITLAFDPKLLDYVDDSATKGPTGGFDTVEEGEGTVTIVHTRLGTSPALAGDLPVTLAFSTIASGDTSITASVSLVDTRGSTTTLSDVATAPVAIDAIPLPPEPSATPSSTPSTDTPQPTATGAASGAKDDGSLAVTGFSIGALVVFATLAIGVGFLVVRRRTASTR
jgi:hypothetical protein